MQYDAILCVTPHHNHIAHYSINSLFLFTSVHRIFVITQTQNFPSFTTLIKKHKDKIILLNEDNIITGVNKRTLDQFFIEKTGNADRAGWYYQQFLKMYICKFRELSEHYLIWDSDTILLKPLNFFTPDNQSVYINPKTEHHQPYFDFIKRTLNIEKQVNFSFITEHFMINKLYMQEVIKNISPNSQTPKDWVINTLSTISIDELAYSGFSEYETYGNYIAYKYPHSIQSRIIHSMRNGTVHYGFLPDKYILFFLLNSQYTTVTFEKEKYKSSKIVKRHFYLKIYSLCNRYYTKKNQILWQKAVRMGNFL